MGKGAVLIREAEGVRFYRDKQIDDPGFKVGGSLSYAEEILPIYQCVLRHYDSTTVLQSTLSARP